MRRFRSFGAVCALSALIVLASCGGSTAVRVQDDSTTTASTTSVSESSPSSTETIAGVTSSTAVVETAVHGNAQAYVDALIAASTADEDSFGSTFTDEQRQCLANKTVEIVTVKRFQTAGITPEALATSENSLQFSKAGLSKADGYDLYDSYIACGLDLGQTMVDSMADDADMTPAVQECLAALFANGNLREFMAASMVMEDHEMEKDPDVSPIMMGLMACVFMGMADSNVNDTAG
ncbi:MAG: hypothetical protein ABIQ39_11440 [Ilumatobacteraceae bacterium]